MLSEETLLGNRYRLEERVATGGMGEVWLATDPVLGRTVAVKLLLPALVSDQDFITRFRTEARLLAALRHPGIVRVYDYGTDALVDGDRRDYLVMEYIDGEPLSERIEAAGRLGVAETLVLLDRAAEALHVAHRAGIVHRDVKPGNLMVQPDGHVVLLDFGLARPLATTTVTSGNLLLGSPQYMAPEQIRGEQVSPATDVYALGVVGYACLTGTAPFTGRNPVDVVKRVLHQEPPPLSRDVPSGLAAVVLRALSKDPAQRHPDAAEFAAAVRGARRGAGLGPGDPPKPARRRRSFRSPRAHAPAVDAPSPYLDAPSPYVDWPTADPAGPTPETRPDPAAPPAGPDLASPFAPAAAGPAPAAPLEPAAAAAAVAETSNGAVGAGPDASRAPAGVFTAAGERAGWRRQAAVAGAATLVLGLAAVAGVLVSGSAPSGPRAVAHAARPPSVDRPVPPRPIVPASPSPTTSEADPTGGPAPRKATRTRVVRAAQPPPRRPGPTAAAKPTPSSSGASPSPSPTASAADPAKLCGPGYRTLRTGRIAKTARVVLLTDSTGDDCVVTLKRTSTATQLSAFLEVQGRPKVTAGGETPVVRAKPGKACFHWGGSASGVTVRFAFGRCG